MRALFTGYNKRLKEYAQELRKHMTPQEKQLWYGFLETYDFPVYRQRIIESYIVDFYCPRARLVIEVDGSQHYTKDGLIHDAIRTDILQIHRLEVVRFSNRDIDERFEHVCADIDFIIKSRVASLGR